MLFQVVSKINGMTKDEVRKIKWLKSRINEIIASGKETGGITCGTGSAEYLKEAKSIMMEKMRDMNFGKWHAQIHIDKPAGKEINYTLNYELKESEKAKQKTAKGIAKNTYLDAVFRKTL